MTAAERNAVAFFAVLAAAGAGARALGLGDRADVRPPTAADRLALQHQLEAVDSAHAHQERGREGRRGGKRVGARRRRASDSTGLATAPLAGAPLAGPSLAVAPARPPARRGPVDVNQADTALLNTVPGVGPALARRIVADRAARGGYASMAELSRVPGIGAGLERRLAGAITFGAVTFTPGGRPSSGSAPGPAGAARGWPAP